MLEADSRPGRNYVSLTDDLRARPESHNRGTSGQFSQTLEVSDLHSKTLHVFFFNERVAEIKLDGDSSDQVTVASNAAQATDS
jgi:hypothetical protein